MAMAKTKMSSATRGNPYGKTGAPGKKPTPEKKSDDGEMSADEIKQMGDMLGREMGPAPQQFRRGGPEQTLQQAPPPKPQMPNLDALRARQMPPGGAPTAPMRGGAMPPGPPDPRFAAMQPPPGAAPQPMPPRPMPDPRLQQLYAQYGIR